MNRWMLVFGTLATVVAVSGCGNKEGSARNTAEVNPASLSQTSGGVAIIDLDEIARLLGRDIQMVNSIRQTQSSLVQQLEEVQNSFQNQINQKQNEFGQQPTEQQTQQLADMEREANQKLNQLKQQAQGNLQQQRSQVIQNFRNEVIPVAQQVAAEKGLSVVLTKNDLVVFAYQPSIDITQTVVQRIKQTAPSGSSTPQGTTARQPDPTTLQR